MKEPHARILMVEDEPQVLEINSRMLRRRGYEVLTAQTAMEAYEQLDAGLPDLLILDILLPETVTVWTSAVSFEKNASVRFCFSPERVM